MNQLQRFSIENTQPRIINDNPFISIVAYNCHTNTSDERDITTFYDGYLPLIGSFPNTVKAGFFQ